MLLKRQTTLSKFISVPDLCDMRMYRPRTSARVLTSLENLQIIEEKEKQKEEKEALKKERLRKREEKRQLKGQNCVDIVVTFSTLHKEIISFAFQV